MRYLIILSLLFFSLASTAQITSKTFSSIATMTTVDGNTWFVTLDGTPKVWKKFQGSTLRTYLHSNVSSISNATGLTGISGPYEGDLAINTAKDTLWIRGESGWIVFKAGTGSGATPNLQSVLVAGNSANSTRITNLGTPIGSADAATKGYVDTQVSSGVDAAGAYAAAVAELQGDSALARSIRVLRDSLARTGWVTQADLANNSVGSNQIQTNAVGADEIANSGVTAGSYTNSNITVDQDGRVTSASNGSGGGGGAPSGPAGGTLNGTYPNPGLAKAHIGVTDTTTVGEIVFMGDSQTKGDYASTPAKAYPRIVGKLTGLTVNNLAANGATIYGVTSLIPTKTTNRKTLVVAYGTNDVNQLAPYTVDTFRKNYVIYMNAALAKGWLGNQIILVNIMPSQNPALTPGSAIDLKIRAFNDTIRSMSRIYGAAYVDTYDFFLKNGGSVYLSVSGHMNDEGHHLCAFQVLAAMKARFNTNRANAAFNGVTQIDTIQLKKWRSLTEGDTYLVGADSTGKLGIARTLPDQTRTDGMLVLDGNIVEKNLVRPSEYSVLQGIYLKTGTKIYGGIDASVWNSFEPMDAGGRMNFRTNYSANLYRFFNSSGTAIFTVSNSDIQTSRLNLNFAGDIVCNPQDALVNAKFSLLSAGGHTIIQNAYRLGYYSWQVSQGERAGTYFDIMRLFPSGHLHLQDPATTFTDVPMSRFAVNDVYKGLRLPRSTTTQRNAYGAITAVTVSSGGTGYTSAPTVTFSNPATGGQLAKGTATVSGGAITSIFIDHPGSGYGGLSPTITLSGGGGTGATFSISPNTTTAEGTALYNTTEQAIEIANGSGGWNQYRRSIQGSATLDFPDTAAGAVSDLTITVTGAADGDVVSVGVPNGSQTTTGRFFAWVSATNTVTVRFAPTVLTGSENPASGTFKITVFK